MALTLRKSTKETIEQKYKKHFEEISSICKEKGWGDPHSYARGKEIYAAIALGHTVAEEYSGPDAFGLDGEEMEYKSTIDKNCKGSYTGISVKDTWPEQLNYLTKEKLGKYEHYYNRFKDGVLVESWMMPGAKVLELLTPKLKKSFEKLKSNKKQKADPRLSAQITWTEIKTYGTKVI
jgi:hypothetical protein